MRVTAALVLLVALLPGCSGALPADGSAADTPEQPRRGDIALSSGDLVLGMPTTAVTDGSVGLGFRVPADATRLTITIDVTVGASLGLRTFGLPGCENVYPDPQIPGDPLVYECDAVPGDHSIRWRFDAGNLRFSAQVHGRAPAGPTA